MQYLGYFFQTLSSDNAIENYNYIFWKQYIYDSIAIYPPLLVFDPFLTAQPSYDGYEKRSKKKLTTGPSIEELVLTCSYHF